MSQTFGASLREARERKGISLRQIAAATKISIATLESLERGDFSRLPGGIFSRAFVRSYAIEVGLDPDATVRRFLEHVDDDVDVPTAAAVAHAVEPVTRRESPAAIRSSTAELAGEFDFETQRRLATVALKLVVFSVPIAAALLYLGSRQSAPLREDARMPPAPPAAARERAEESPPPAPVVQPVKAEAPGEPQVEPQVAPQVEPAPALDAAVTIEIAPSGDCWAKVTADGRVVVSRNIKAGERETAAFRDSATLLVGDAAACAISIDGRPARPLGPPRRVREVRITRENYTSFFP